MCATVGWPPFTIFSLFLLLLLTGFFFFFRSFVERNLLAQLVNENNPHAQSLPFSRTSKCNPGQEGLFGRSERERRHWMQKKNTATVLPPLSQGSLSLPVVSLSLYGLSDGREGRWCSNTHPIHPPTGRLLAPSLHPGELKTLPYPRGYRVNRSAALTTNGRYRLIAAHYYLSLSVLLFLFFLEERKQQHWLTETHKQIPTFCFHLLTPCRREPTSASNLFRFLFVSKRLNKKPVCVCVYVCELCSVRK